MRSGPARRATIQDVAQSAGVSVSAVSKVLREAYGVSPEMRVKVTAAIEKLGYRPHAGARGMRGRSFTVGVVLTEMSSPFQPEVVDGINDQLEPSPFQAIMTVGGADAEHQKRSIEALVDRQVDGLILIASFISQPWLEKLTSTIPTVVVARHGGGANYDSVVDDDYEGARLMVDHLVALGHRRILHTSHPSGGLKRPFVLSHTARCEGYVNAMERHGLEPDVIETTYSELGGYQATVEALGRTDPPTAIFAGADIAALGALRAAEELGRKVPDDLTVAGYDNIYITSIGRISLTTVDQSGHLTGTTSARLLLERIEGRSRPVHYVVAPRLVPRGTSAGPALSVGRPRGKRKR
ncbi:LacI family DNA-binding transcriptional regulator [Kribbella speibonae]|uniref:LacI family transcriptional regulator n=1 Tax=Kribbella speibonae TaxID=1572660 RepID=A0A4R0IXJ2_9ACTN|nr:LacI family DNA-binding transcriptional regulator [Kribbella speibonae]TCC36396.1 LacI family transcriptional regulator [Kribbella speibonae]